MKYLKRFLTCLKITYYLIRLLIAPKNSLIPLIKLGNIISNSKAFDKAANKILANADVKALVDMNYGSGIPENTVLLKKPESSFGFHLGQFMTVNKLNRYPFPIKNDYSSTIYLRERRRHIHDILHVVLDYDTSLEGEAKVNAFICGQSAFPIPVIISTGVLLISLFKFPSRVNEIYNDLTMAYQRGKSSPSIFAIRWEERWEESLEDLKAIFATKATASYNI